MKEVAEPHHGGRCKVNLEPFVRFQSMLAQRVLFEFGKINHLVFASLKKGGAECWCLINPDHIDPSKPEKAGEMENISRTIDGLWR